MAGPERPPTLEHTMKLKVLISLFLFTLVACLSTAAHAQTFSVIHAFNGASGENPLAGVTLRGGVLYGTTDCVQNCGGAGVVYKISPMGSNWFYTPISLFSAGGYGPEARVLFGPDNQLYGTTPFGGQAYGIVFSLTPMPTICKTANCFWAEKVLYQFAGIPDGVNPGYGDLVWDSMGNIYGTTTNGGTSNHGTAYRMTKSGNDWTESIIYSFTGHDGDNPTSGVILDSNGNLFGTAEYGGANGFGSVFELTPSGNGWIETNIYDFQDDADGEYPIAGLMMDGAGNIYGATSDGGSGGGGRCLSCRRRTMAGLSPSHTVFLDSKEAVVVRAPLSRWTIQGIYTGRRSAMAPIVWEMCLSWQTRRTAGSTTLYTTSRTAPMAPSR